MIELSPGEQYRKFLLSQFRPTLECPCPENAAKLFARKLFSGREWFCPIHETGSVDSVPLEASYD